MWKNKSYYLFFLTVVIFSIFQFFSNNENNLDVNIHDIYFVFGRADLYLLFAVFNLFLGLIYLIFQLSKVMMFKNLSQIHVYGTLLTQLLFFYFDYKNSIDEGFTIFDGTDYNAKMVNILIVIILLQMLLIINIFASLIKKIQ